MEKEIVSEPLKASASDAHAPESLSAELLRTTGLSPSRCYQCGKCSAGCPMAAEMPLRPHQMLRLAQLNLRDRLLSDPSLWLCLTCETCSARCPNQVDPARLIDGLREIALRHQSAQPPARIRAFHEAFLKQIHTHGRIAEFGLVLSYKLRSGALFDDVTQAPGMYLRGKLKLMPHTIQGVDDVRRIMDACQAEEEG